MTFDVTSLAEGKLPDVVDTSLVVASCRSRSRSFGADCFAQEYDPINDLKIVAFLAADWVTAHTEWCPKILTCRSPRTNRQESHWNYGL